jgi:hypothetical protein
MTIQEIVEKIGMHNITLKSGGFTLNPNDWVKANIDLVRANKPGIIEYVTEQHKIRAEERAAKWATQQAAQDAVDKPLLDAMQAHAAELRAQIPAGHIQVTVKQTGDMDGDPILKYTADGVNLNWQDVNFIGVASAVRPGAIGSFASIYVASISRKNLEEIRTVQQANSAAAQASKSARENELKVTEIPAAAVSAYNHYHGDAEAAWNDSDESAWALIQKWTPYIVVQHGMDIEQIKRVAADVNKEASYGINEG